MPLYIFPTWCNIILGSDNKVATSRAGAAAAVHANITVIPLGAAAERRSVSLQV